MFWQDSKLIANKDGLDSKLIVWQTQVQVGQTVKAGDVLLILESMKMEINITASSAGKVTHLLKADGARVQAGQTLVVLEAI